MMLGKDKPNRFGAASQLAVKAQVFLSPTYPCDGWNLALSGMHIYGWVAGQVEVQGRQATLTSTLPYPTP